MPQFGSNRSIASQAFVNLTDQLGNPLVSTDSSFGSSPLGTAPLTQAFFGLPNATFNLTPPDVLSVIDGTNSMPYWDVENSSSLVMSATSVYDATTETWGVKLDPGTAVAGNYLILKTRSYLVNDDNLGLRQKAFAVITKNGTYSGSTQWNLQMSATYYSATDTALHTAVIGTALDNATWTSLSGFTTTSGTAISASARYVDLAFTLTATATVTSATSVTIKSALLSTKVGANSSFLVTETFTASATWTRPTGVTNLISVVAIGAGGGGGGGCGTLVTSPTAGSAGGAYGGGGGGLVILQNLYVGDVATVSVGIGAGGAGGTPGVGDSTIGTRFGGSASNGGATTFGSYISIGGGRGGWVYPTSAWNTPAVDPAPGGTATSTAFGAWVYNGGTGGQVNTTSSATGTAGTASAGASYSATRGTAWPPTGGSGYPNQNFTLAAGDNGGARSAGATQGTAVGTAGAGGIANYAGGGGGATPFVPLTTSVTNWAPTSGPGGAGGGGGGGEPAYFRNTVAAGTYYAGNGGAGAAYTGGGGGGGGPCGVIVIAGSAGRFASGGTGGAGATGIIAITYVA
jgi:hypothetical protein